MVGVRSAQLERSREVFETAPDLLTWRELTHKHSPGLDEFRGDPWATHFTGRLFHREFERVTVGVVEIEGGKHVVERTERQIRQAPTSELIALMQLSGSSCLHMARGPRVLQAGDMVIHSTDTPYSLEFEGGVSCFVIRFPAQMLGLPPGVIDRLGAGWRADELTSGRLVSSMLSATADHLDVFASAAGPSLANNLVDLLKTTFVEYLDAAPGHTYSKVFARIVADMEARLSDPELTPSGIAESNFISVRHLHGLFREHGTTVSRWIREKRLERCARDLADPTQQGIAVREIAERWGYENATHFSTSFKEYTGLSPSDWRRRAVRRSLVEVADSA